MIAYLENKRPVADARALGADCDNCPLKNCKPVAPETSAQSRLVIVGENPSLADDESGKMFSGSAGYRLNKACKELGIKRGDLHLTTAVLCHPKHKLSPKEWTKALAACAPRLAQELKDKKPILACGAKALQATTGKAKIMSWMGSILPSPYGDVVSSIHPNFTILKPAYLPVFKTFLNRAWRHANEAKPWVWPTLVIDGDVLAALGKVLAFHQLGQPIAIDIESNPITKEIRCVGVGTAQFAVSVPFLDEYKPMLRAILAIPNTKVLQNAQFDLIELKEIGFEINGPIYDTMLAHAVLAPQLPHNLGFMGAVEFSAERWKTLFHVEGDDKSGEALQRFAKAPLDELLAYNAKDVAATALLKVAFDSRIKSVFRGQELIDKIHALDAIAMRMRERGITVAKDNFARHRHNLNTILDACRDEFQSLTSGKISLGKSGQHPDLGPYFFDKLGCQPVAWSEETQKPSLNSEALQTYIAMYASSKPVISNLARTIYRYRKHSKLLGSYVDNLPVGTDGKVHPWWRVFGARTGRWSAKDPGIQTIPKENLKAGMPTMRDLFCAQPGMWLVEADYSQLELRIVALLSGDEKLLDWYEQGLDVHTMNAGDIFQTKTPTKQQRDLAKRVVYGMNYGGSAETIWRSLITDFPGLPQAAVAMVVKGWFKAHPAIQRWQEALVATAKAQNYVEETLSGRRQYYHDGRIQPTQVLNFPVQGAAGELANRAVIAASAALNWDSEGLLAQVHDSLLLEGPNQAKLVEVVKSAMEQKVDLNGAVIKFPVDISVGKNWGAMQKIK